MLQAPDPPLFTLIRRSTVRTGKPRTCADCGLTFPLGTECTLQVIKDEDGRVRSYYSHTLCPWTEELEGIDPNEGPRR